MKLQELSDRIESEMKLRNFSQKTTEAYLGCLGDYFVYIKTVKKFERKGAFVRKKLSSS